MKSEGINQYSWSNRDYFINFEGKRVSKNVVAQLAKNNPYSLNEPNQRAISTAISDLGKVKGLKNIKFLMDTAAKNKYATSITLEDAPKNNWREKLMLAAMSALALTSVIGVDASDWLDKINAIGKNKNLNNDEKRIMALRDELLKSADLEQIKKETIGTAKNFKRNLDYLIVSSETTLEHKKYILERLNYFMSDEYEINPQLKDKKSVALAEMVNDMAISLPGVEVPNIKAVNQKQHGMCAAISIVRKKLVYEDKPDYVDAILSELDTAPYIMVYDRSYLGSKKKVEVSKTPVDYTTAIAKGYRIIDAATMNWMQIAHMNGKSNCSYNLYNPFDSENFDVKTDSFFNVHFQDESLSAAQAYYQALIKSKEIIESYKAKRIKKDENTINRKLELRENLETIGKIQEKLRGKLSNLSSNINTAAMMNAILHLEHNYSKDISAGDKFAYISNEEEIVKKDKIKSYILANSDVKEISDKDIDGIYSLVEFYNATVKSMGTPSHGKAGEIRKAQDLYEIGAAFRYQIIMGLQEKSTIDNLIRLEGLPDKEQMVLKTIDTLLEKLRKNSSDSEIIRKNLSANTGANFVNNEVAIDFLENQKSDLELLLTIEMDDLYRRLTLKSRVAVLNDYIENQKEMILNGDGETVVMLAEQMGIKPDATKVLNELEKIQSEILTGDENLYKKAYGMLGGVSQIAEIRAVFDMIMNQVSYEDNKEFVETFIAENDLPEKYDSEKIIETLNAIKKRIDGIDEKFERVRKALKINAEDGDVLYSAYPVDNLIKKYENEKDAMISYSALKELQTHMYKIQKDKSSDEFQSRQGKLKDKSLYKFSSREKETLSKIEKNLDEMDTCVEKELVAVRNDIKDYLESLKKIIGVNSGHFWVREGSSGLADAEEIGLLEYITGRPHYVQNDIKKAIDIIKNGPYSGISSSSVYHNEPGMHAQYIADIKPIKVMVKDENGNVHEEEKEVLLHDNTWGASEHENTWVDKDGILRTDYSDNRGGTRGYITNEKYQNGNYVDRILGDMVLKSEPDDVTSKQYKNIKHTDKKSLYNFPQYDSIILDGKSPNLKNIAAGIHDSIFLPSYTFLDSLGLQAASMTEKQAQRRIESVDLAGKGWKSKYEELIKRILDDGKYGSAIRTKEDYDKLADGDYLKVALEKVAIKQNGNLAGSEPKLALVKNVKDLAKFRKEQRRRALEAFKYTFGKNSGIIDYIASSFDDSQYEKVFEILKKNNSKTTEDEFYEKFVNLGVSDVGRLNGSVAKTVRLILEDADSKIDEIVEGEQARKEVKEFIHKFVRRKAYFQESDLSNKSLKNVIDFIDREFDPEDNQEFVKIFRQIQDMPLDEFKEKILPRVTRADLELKDITGYDVLKKIQRYEEKYEDKLMNTVYYDTLVPDLKSEDYKGEYNYKRLKREVKYVTKYNFNTIYRNMKDDLEYLTLKKMFNKYKGKNLQLYGVYPAYPEVNAASDEMYKTVFDGYFNAIEDMIKTINTLDIQRETYDIVHKLDRYVKKLGDEHVLTDYQFKDINNLLGRLVTMNYGDETIAEMVDLAMDTMNLEKGTKFGEYKEALTRLIDDAEVIERMSPVETLDSVGKSNKEMIRKITDSFIRIHIQERYQSKIYGMANDLVKAYQGERDKYEELKAEFNSKLREYHRLHNPKELLQEYIKSETKDGRNADIKADLKNLLLRALNYAMLADVQWQLMDAMGDGQAMDAKMLFNTISVKLSDDAETTMDTGEAIRRMAHTLVIDGNVETAILFLDKLGLNDEYVIYMSKVFNFEQMKKEALDMIELSNNYSGFMHDLTELGGVADYSFSIGKNYINVIDKYKKGMRKLGKHYGIRKDVMQTLLKTADQIKEICADETKDPMLTFNSLMKIARDKTDSIVMSAINAADARITSDDTVVNLINRIMLRKGSEAEKARDKINKEYEEVTDYLKAMQQDDLQEDEESANI